MTFEHSEIEVRFLDIDQEGLIKKLIKLAAKDLGEEKLEEIIFYDKDLTWQSGQSQFVRLRKTKKAIYLTYKNHKEPSATGTEEIEFEVSDIQKAQTFLERLELRAVRHQEKKRHSFKLDDVAIDIDTWPRIPTYVELEGPSEQALKSVAAKLGLDWSKVVFENAAVVIEKYYNVPVTKMRWFTFERFE